MNMKIQEYKIISDMDQHILSKEINKALLSNWQPYGSLVVSPCQSSNRFLYSQVIVRKLTNIKRKE